MSAASPSVTAMSKSPRAAHRCTECGWETSKWVGRCGECQAWGSVVEAATPVLRATATAVTTPAVPIGQVDVSDSTFRSSGVPELDRVLGGGLVPGAAILLAGEPGVGKSTLLLEVASQTARVHRRTLYITGEESASQVRLRADRTGGVHDELFLAAETDLGAVLSHIEAVRPSLLVVDSIQTISAPGLDATPGGVSHVKEVAAALIRVAKTRNITTVHRRARHQGRLDRRPTGARARRRRGAALRGRPQLPLPHGPGDEEPLRPGRRGRLLRPVGRRHHRGHRPDRPLRRAPRPPGARHLRGGHDGGPPPDAGRDPGAW